MKKIILLFVVAFVCVFSTGDLFAKGKVKVDKALEHAARQYLYMRDELKGTNQFPIQNGGVVAFIPELYFICMKKQEMKNSMPRECVC